MSGQDPSPRRAVARRAPALMVAAVIAASSILAFAAGTAALSTPSPADSLGTPFQAEADTGDLIPISPLTDLSSLDATVHLSADGTVDGEPTQGDLTVELSSNDQNTSRIDITGSLLRDVVAQVGGKAVSLFRPKSVSIYTMPEGTFAVVTGLLDVCVKLEDSEATEALEQLSPQFLLSTLTSSDVARGTFVGDETLDGVPVKQYVVNGESFLTAAQASSDPNVSLFAQSLRTATDADLSVVADGGYPVAYRGGFGGTFEPLEFDGDLTLEVEVTSINSDTPVTLPVACDKPISL